MSRRVLKLINFCFVVSSRVVKFIFFCFVLSYRVLISTNSILPV